MSPILTKLTFGLLNYYVVQYEDFLLRHVFLKGLENNWSYCGVIIPLTNFFKVLHLVVFSSNVLLCQLANILDFD